MVNLIMSDLISRKETIKAIDNLCEVYISYYNLLMLINRLPSAEPERKKGYWINTDNYYQRWKCSECGCHTRDAEPNYCPHCGADMRDDYE